MRSNPTLKTVAALWLALILAPLAYGATPAGCENETGLASRTDILKCESFESSTWYTLGWYRDQGDTGDFLDGRRFHRFPADAQAASETSIVNTGCMVGSCLKVTLRDWTQKIGSSLAMSYIIPGQGGCSHSNIGCVPQQEVYLRYYLRLAPNYDPENYSFADGSAQGAGGKWPGLADATNGYQNNPSIQCGNGGEGPTNGTECWSARLNFNVPWHTDNGPRNACLERRVYNCTTRFGLYPYLYVPFQVEGSRYTSAFADSFYSPPIDWYDNSVPPKVFQNGNCDNTYGFHCGIGDPGLINNKWYLVEQRIKMNTPGVADGVMQVWLDGELRYSKTNTMFRLPGHNNVGIRQAWFDIYAGGFALGYKENTWLMIDQMVVSTTARPGPWSGTQRGNMVVVNQDPGQGMNGFSRGHYVNKVKPANGGCYFSMFGLGSVTGGDNSHRCGDMSQTASGNPGVWTYLTPNTNSDNVATPPKRDNYGSLYLPWQKKLILFGGSYIEPTVDREAFVSGVLDLADCATAFTTNCGKWTTLSKWTPSNTAVNANAAFTNGAGADSGKFLCNFPPCSALIKNPTLSPGQSWRTDNAAACNDNIRVCMHGWGFSNNGQHWVLTENINNTLCNPGAATGNEPLIHCELPSNPKNIPVFTDNNNCSATPTGAGTTPGWRAQAMNVLVPGPDRRRAFYLLGTFATPCLGNPVNVNDFWVFNSETATWTQLAPPPHTSYTPLGVYDSVRNAVLAQMDDKIYAYPLFGGTAWSDITPASGLGFASFNSYGTFAEAGELFLIHDGNESGGGGGPHVGLKAFSMNSASVLSEPVVTFVASTSSGSEATTIVNIPVSLINPPGGTVTVNYAVTGGSATGGGVDYTLASGTLTFTGGSVLQNIVLSVNNDSASEPSETVQITLSSPSVGTLGTSVHVYTILDNDAAGGPPGANTQLGIGAKIGAGGRIGGL